MLPIRFSPYIKLTYLVQDLNHRGLKDHLSWPAFQKQVMGLDGLSILSFYDFKSPTMYLKAEPPTIRHSSPIQSRPQAHQITPISSSPEAVRSEPCFMFWKSQHF